MSKLPAEKALRIISLFPQKVGFTELSKSLDRATDEGIISLNLSSRLESAWRARDFKLVGDIVTESLKKEENVF